MATEAEIIPEPISIVKTEEESRHLTSELCDKAVEFLPGDLKQFASGLNQPDIIDESLAKPENMKAHGENGVETKSTVFEGNAEISKGEGFLVSPEIAAVASKETSEMSGHIEVDETPIKAEKIPEDEKHKGDIDEGTGLKTKKKEEVGLITDQDSSLVEKSGSIEEESNCSQKSKQEVTKKDENADIDINKEVISIPEANLELQKQASIDASDSVINSLKPKETVIEFSDSNVVQEEEEDKSSIEVKDTELEKLPVLPAKEDGKDVTELFETSKEASDEMNDEEITVPLSEGKISEVESVDVSKQRQEGNLDEEEIPKKSFQQQNEPEMEKPACPLNALHEDVTTAISGENEETSTSIKEVTSITDHEEKFEGEGMEETTTNTCPVSENKESKETDNLQVEAKESTETVEVEIPKKNADYVHGDDSLIGQSVEKDNENEISSSQLVLEANVESKEMEEHREDVSEVATTTTDLRSETSEMTEEKVKQVNLLDSEKCSQKDEAMERKQDEIQEEEEASTAEKPEIEMKGEIEKKGDISEKDVTEESRSNTEQDETEESNKEKTIIAEEDFERISPENDPQENLECLTSQETETDTSKANEIPSLMEEETAQDSEEDTEKEEKVKGETDDDSTKEKGITKEEVETITKGYELESKEQLEPKDAVENIEENSKLEETEQEKLQIEANESSETVNVEIPKKNADCLHVDDSLVGQSVEKDNKKQYEISDSQPVIEDIVESKEKEEHSEDVSEAATTKDLRSETSEMAEEKVKEVNLLDSEQCSQKDEDIESKQYGIQEEEEASKAEKPEIETRGDISEKDVPEERRSKTEQDETEESNKEKTIIAEEESERISPVNEPQENLEFLPSQETKTVTSKANEIPSLVEEETVQDCEETTEKEEKVKDETDDNSTEEKGITKEEFETITEGYELESKEQLEPMDAVESIEENSEHEETEQFSESPEPIIKEECAIKDDIAKSTEEEMHKSVPEDEQKEIPEVEVYEKLETNNTVEDAEKPIAEEVDTNKDQPAQLTETAEEKSKEIIEDDSKAESKFEVSTSATDKEVSFEKENEEREPKKEVCKESEPVASGTGKENPDTDEHPIADISNSSISDETVKQSIKEDESSSMKLTAEATNSYIEETESVAEKTLQTSEETAEPNNNPNLLDTTKESNEITTKEIKEELISGSPFENEEEETSVKGRIDTTGLDVASTATETEETNIKEVKAEDEKQKTDNVIAVEKNGLSTTEQEGIGVDGADIDVKPADSIPCENDREITQEEDGMQDKVPNAGSEDQLETTAREIALKEILGGEAKEHCTVHPEEHEHAPIEERKITDETSEKGQAPYDHSETPVPQATDEILMQKEYNPTVDVPKEESEDTEKQSGHDQDLAEEPNVLTERETEKCISLSEATDVSKGEEPRELENQSDACESKTSQEEQSSDLGLEREKTDDENSLDEATKLGETSSTFEDGEKAIQEEENIAENLAKPESLKKDTEVEKEETELLTQAHNEMPEANNNAKNVELELASSEEKPKSVFEKVAEEQKKEPFPEPSENPADEISTDVQNQETEKQITEEPKDKLVDEDCINREQNADEVTKAVILSEEVDKEVKKAEDIEDIKEHVTDEGTTEDAETVKSLRVEELNGNEIEETKGIPETSSVNISRGVETIGVDDISSHNTLPDDKQEEQLSADKSEGTTSSALLPKEHEETVTMVEKIQEENVEEVETPLTKISEDSSGEKKTEEIPLEKEEFPELEDVEKDDNPAAENLQAEEQKDQSITSTSTLLSEDVEHGTIAKADELEGVKLKEVELIENERPQESEAVEDQEEQLQTSASTLPPEDEEIRNAHQVEKTEEVIQKDAEVVKHDSLEVSSDRKTTEEVCLQKVEERELKAASEEETITGQGLEKEEPEEQIQTTSLELLEKERPQESEAVEDQEEKQEEQLQTSASTLPSEDEEIRNAHQVEKTEEEIQRKDAEVVKHESLEDSSNRKTTEEECLQKVEEREIKAASEEETITGQVLEKEEPEEQIQTASSTLPSEETEHGTGVTTEEIEYDKTKEEVPAKLDFLSGGEHTGEQTPSANKTEEGTTSSALLPKEQEETVSRVEKIEEENIKEVEIPDTKISEDSSDEKKTAEISMEKEEFPELEDAKKDETTPAQVLQAEELKDQSITSSSTLPSEDIEHKTIAKADEVEEEKVKEVETLEKERPKEPEAVMDQEIAVSQASSTEESQETISTFEKLDEEKRKEAEKQKNENCEDSSARGTEEICLQKEEPNFLHAVSKEEITSGQTSKEEKPEEHISTSAITSEEQGLGTKKIEDEKTSKEEIIKEESPENASDARTVEEICSQKEKSIELEAVLEDEKTADLILTEKKIEEQVEDPTSALPSKEEEIVSSSTSENPDKAEFLQDDKGKDEKEELQVGEALATSTLPSEEKEDERKETELQQDESSKKIPEQTREIEEASNVKAETLEKAFDNELQTKTEDVAIEEKLVKESDEARDEENQCEKTNEGNKIILNEVSKEEVIEKKQVSETSYSTSLSEELTKDSIGGDELKNEQVEDMTNKASETTTCQNEKLIVEAQKSSENETIEKQIVFEDKTIQDPDDVSVARIDSATVTEEEPSVKLSQAEGTNDLGESNEITDDIQQPEETCKASDEQIPRELDPTEITDVTSSVGKEAVPIDLQDRVAESSEKAEVGDIKEAYSKAEEVENGAEKTTKNLGEEITKESVAVEDSTNVLLSDHVKRSTEENVHVTDQDITEERVEDKTSAAQIPVQKPEEESLAPSSKFPSKEGKHDVTDKVETVEEEELQEVETLDRDSCGTKPGAEICSEKEENKELKAVMEQDTIAVQAPTAELKEDKELAQPTVSHFEDVNKEEEEKGESIEDKTKETLKAPVNETQNEELSVETQKDSGNNNIEKEIVAEDKTVKDLEQASVGMKEERTVKEEIPGKADRIESTETISSIGKEQFPIEQHERALEIPDKAEVGELEPGNAQEICSKAGVDHEEEKKTYNSGVEVTQEAASADSAKSSLSEILQRDSAEKLQVAKDVIQERELIVSKEEQHVEEEGTVKVKEAKTDEEKEEGEEGDEHNRADSGSDAPVMVEAPRDTDTKPHKKSHNILSGMGSKVKHSISKVKKAITGKSSHSKEPQPTSPKESEK